MGQVYKAFDPRLDRQLAIKVAVERFSARFEREARADLIPQSSEYLHAFTMSAPTTW